MNSTVYSDICYLTVSFFSVEFILRIVFCPRKLKFFVDPLHLIDLFCILQDVVFVSLISTTSSTSVHRRSESQSASSPSARGPIGDVSLDAATSEALQKYNKKFRFFYVLKIFRYFTSLRILADAMTKGWKALGKMILKEKFTDFSIKNPLFFTKVLYLSYLLTGALIFANFVYYAENFASSWNDYGNSSFSSITRSMW